MTTIQLPEIVGEAEWRAAHEALLAKEKVATRARDALAAERRRQPKDDAMTLLLTLLKILLVRQLLGDEFAGLRA